MREIANVVLALAPLALAAVAAAFERPRPAGDGAGAVLVALALPFAAMLLFVHPRQGVFRDWDVFSPAAMALAMLAARELAIALKGARRAGLGLAVVLAALAPAVQWLWLEHDLGAGFARVRAYLAGPPPRPEADRALTWDYLGSRLGWLDSLDASAEAYAHAAALTPSPRLLYMWARAEAARKDYPAARDVLLRLTARAGTWADAWGALAFVSQQLGDANAARAAAGRALALDPDDALARGVMRTLPPGPARGAGGGNTP